MKIKGVFKFDSGIIDEREQCFVDLARPKQLFGAAMGAAVWLIDGTFLSKSRNLLQQLQ